MDTLRETNLFLSTTFVNDGLQLTKALELCKNSNLRFVELGSNHCYSSTFDLDVKNYNFIYLVHNYFPIPKIPFVLNIASLNENIFRRSITHIFNAIDFCDRIGAKLYTFHPGFLSDPIGSNSSTKNLDFQWGNKSPNKTNYDIAYENMLRGIYQCAGYAQKKNVKIAIETEGSFNKNQFLLMQKPEEYERFFKEFNPSDIGINLNIGHLNLASHAFHFNTDDFVNIIADYIVAMELSHNDGYEDQHLPLLNDAWYWTIIFDNRFIDSYKILEFRNTSFEMIEDNIKLFNEKFHAI